jgi:uncharacterized membrane protein
MANESKPETESTVEKVEASDIVEIISKQNPRLFNGIKKEKQAEIVKAFSIGFMQIQKHHSGPLPDAETLEHYSNIIPNGAERIMVMAEKEQDFRHGLSTDESKRILNQRGIGQIFGFIIAIVGIGGGIFLAYSGKETAGLTSIISAMVLLAGAFITGKLTNK